MRERSARLTLSFSQLEGELYNGRVAMLAVVGILTVEALGRGPWWQAYNTVRRRLACISYSLMVQYCVTALSWELKTAFFAE